MAQAQSSHWWLGTFAARLLQLRPSLSVGKAVQLAVVNLHRASDLDPFDAADLFVRARVLAGQRAGTMRRPHLAH